MVDELPDTRIALKLLQDSLFTLQADLGRTFEHDLFVYRIPVCVVRDCGALMVDYEMYRPGAPDMVVELLRDDIYVSGTLDHLTYPQRQCHDSGAKSSHKLRTSAQQVKSSRAQESNRPLDGSAKTCGVSCTPNAWLPHILSQ
jgi:hypothetical protein